MAPQDFHHPFQPYDIQQQFMEAVYSCIEDGKVGILESPTGTGKSLSLICGSLTWLREHKRKKFDEAIQKIEVDDDEPEWMAEHARESKRKEALQMRAEFEARLAKVRDAEKKVRQRQANGEPLHKRRRQGDIREKRNDGDDNDDQYILDDYESDQERTSKGDGQSQYSAETLKLFEKLGMFQPDTQNQDSDDMAEELKIYFCSRTHSQLSQFIGELQRVQLPAGLPVESLDSRTNERPSSEQVKQISLGSRKNLCINNKVAKLSSQTAINERCMELQQSNTPADKKCPYIPGKDDESLVLDFRDHALASIRDIEDLADVGKKLGVCPYYASRPAVGPAEVVTLPYPLMLQKSAREALGLSLQGHVVIIDEAHNLMDAVEGICSSQITAAQLRMGRESLMTYLQKFRNKLKGSNRVYVTQVIRVIDSLLLAIADLERNKSSGGSLTPGTLLAGKGVDQVNLFKLVRYISNSKLARKVEGYVAHLKQVDASKQKSKADLQTPETPTLTQIQNFLMTLMNPSKEGQFFWSREDGSMILRYMLLDPSEHFRDVVESARAVILAGGTMSPMDDYSQQLFPYLPWVMMLSCGHIIPPDNLLVRPLTHDDGGALEFNYKSRSDPNTIARLGDALLTMLPTITGGTVIFFPSYVYLDQVRKQWDGAGITTQMHNIKPAFFDSRTISTDDTFKAYSETVQSDPRRGALLFSVIGGKLSEGINFSDNLGRCVMVVGLPYPNIETPGWKAKLQYLDDRAAARGEPKGKAGSERVMNVCMRAVNQAIGRAIRHQNDWASITLIDARYGRANVQGKLPNWIKESLPDPGAADQGRLKVVAHDMRLFFERRKA